MDVNQSQLDRGTSFDRNVCEHVGSQTAIQPRSNHSLLTDYSNVPSTLPVNDFMHLSYGYKQQNRILYQEFIVNKLQMKELRIFGREAVVDRLKHAFYFSQEQGRTTSRLVSVSGYSGMGKSAIVKELRPVVMDAKGYYCYGKFDLQQLGEPYAAFSGALFGLVEQIMTGDESLCDRIRSSLLDSLGTAWTELADVLPNLPDLLGDEEDRSRTPQQPNGRCSQLCFLLQLFLRVVCNSQEGSAPIVLVLDDLQWVDAMSLQMMEAILTDPLYPPIQLIITYRENEVDAEHSLTRWLRSVEKHAKIDIDRIELGPLDVASVNSMVATLLRFDEESTVQLSEVIHRKTGGNAFFVIQFLQSLIDDELLSYNLGALRWTWDVDEIQLLPSTDNVGDLMSFKLRKLHETSKIVLQVASCLGHSFEAFVVSRVIEGLLDEEWLFGQHCVDLASLDVLTILESFVNETGLMERYEATYCFVHDQIQQAALDLVPADRRLYLRRRVGERLLLVYDESQKDQHLFTAVDLCNEAICIPELMGKYTGDLSLRNLAASELAMRKGAFGAALRYSECGLMYLGAGRWSSDKDLTHQLTCLAAEAAYCTGNYDKVELYYNDALKQGIPLHDMTRIVSMYIRTLGSKQRVRDATNIGLSVLKQFGVISLSDSPGKLRVFSELMATKRILRKYSRQQLEELPLATDERWISVLKIADVTETIGYMRNPYVAAVLSLRVIRWSLLHGFSKCTPLALTYYGLFLCCLLGKYEDGIEIGEVAISLANRLGAPECISKTIASMFAFIFHWKNEMRLSIEPFQYGFQLGMKSGDVEVALFNALQRNTVIFQCASHHLDELLSECEEHRALVGTRHERIMIAYLQNLMQLIENMSSVDCDSPFELSGQYSDEEQLRKKAAAEGNIGLMARIDSYRMYLAYMFGDYEAASEFAETTKEYGVNVSVGLVTVPWHVFFSGLTAVAAVLQNKKLYRKNCRVVKGCLKKLEGWHKLGNRNILHMILLLRAEFFMLLRKNEDAKELYSKAKSEAARAGFKNDVALVCERAASFHWTIFKDTYWSEQYYGEAVTYYNEWGAKAKVRQLIGNRDKFGCYSNSISRLTMDSQAEDSGL